MPVPRSRCLLISVAFLAACVPSRPPEDTAGGTISFVQLGDGLEEGVELLGGSGAGSTADGAIFVASELSTGLVMRVDSTGRKLGTIGAIGAGPGEYPRATFLFTKGDSVLIQSGADGMFRVFTSAGHYVRSFRTPILMGPGRGLALRGDTLVLVEQYDTQGASGLPIHLVAPDGAVIRSFGGGEVRSRTRPFALSMIRDVARESDSSFWVARRDRYTLELWNTAGVRERVLDLQRDWFPLLTKNPGDPRYERPATTLRSFHRDASGHLMVVLLRAVAGWQPEPRPAGQPTAVPMNAISKYEYVVEVLDPITGELLAATVKDSRFNHGHFLANGLAYGLARSSETGATAPAFWRVTYHPTRGGGER